MVTVLHRRARLSRVSDWLGDFMCFLRCNDAHHRIAMLPGPPCLNHVAYDMLERRRHDARRQPAAARRASTCSWGPGRHTAGNNTFSYFITPNGFAVEYTAELEEVDEATGSRRSTSPGRGSWTSGASATAGRRPCRTRARCRPVPARRGLTDGAVPVLPATTSGTSPSRSRSRAAARSARSWTCASRLREAAARGDDAGTAGVHGAMGGDGRQAARAGGRGRGARAALFSASRQAGARRALLDRGRADAGPWPSRAAKRPMRGRGRPSPRRRARRRERASASRFRYEGKTLPALLTRAPGDARQAPCVLYCNGLDSCKELLLLVVAAARAGAARRLDAVRRPARHRRSAAPLGPAGHGCQRALGHTLRRLARARADIDAKRIGMTGISLGGYFAPRAVAFEPRFASGAVWGANHNWPEVQHKRLMREGENPVPHYWAHVQWVFGARDMRRLLRQGRGHEPQRHHRPHPSAVPRHPRREGPPDRARPMRTTLTTSSSTRRDAS